MSKDNDEEKGIKVWIFISIAVGLFIISLGTYIYYNFYEQSISKSSADWGTFGDFMGGTLNPMLAFLSLIALLYTIKLQSKELSLSRKELAETQKATRDSATALEAQSESIKLQNFENTFFNMLDLHNKIVDNILVRQSNYFDDSADETLKGREALKNIYDDIDKRIRESSNNIKKFNKKYDETYNSFESNIGHYFGNIYQILKFISESDKTIKKRKYSNLFRAQFSSEELKLLFYHCTGEIGSKKFKKLVEKFGFFEHLVLEEYNQNFSFIIRTSIYSLNAFGKNKERIQNYKKAEDLKRKSQLDSLTIKYTRYNNDLEILNKILYFLFEEKNIEKIDEYIKKAEDIINKIDKPVYRSDIDLYLDIKKEIEEEFPEIKPSSLQSYNNLSSFAFK
ncbi:putative phage abortive infection protein [Halarcobacter sp.]|uniref:putative phage abortive infection protein n=1 Tax=Halarcobacter sp. TaxID=2321133 RepID=UPI003A945999